MSTARRSGAAFAHRRATSRETLGLPGEVTYRVPSMALPDLRPASSFEQVLLYDAVRLFADRATLA